MTVDGLLAKVEQLGIVLTVKGDRLHVQAPKGILTADLRRALAAQKPDLIRRLAAPPPDATGGTPCPACGAAEWWQWLAGRRVCRPCLIREAPERAV
jgi:hypothetical protein